MWKFTIEYKNGTVSAADFAVTAYRIYDVNSELIGSNSLSDIAIAFSCNHEEARGKLRWN